MKHATLLGRDHTVLGELAAVAEGPAAITICRGGAAKTYAHVDPNEDAALFALGPAGLLLAVADGHDGHQGSQAAIETLRDDFAPVWCRSDSAFAPDRWSVESARAVAAANHAVLAEAGARGSPPAPTTLAFALWRKREGCVLGASVGDSHVFFAGADQATRDVARDVARKRRSGDFLGRGALDEAAAEALTIVGVEPASALHAIVLATDGLSERGIGVEDPEAEVQRAREHAWAADDEIRPLAVAKAVSAVALAAQRRQQAGDNIACAVALLPG